ncbi:M24 family metallopeptidase [Alicyclobacillus curvatus]|nr:M24 family metallopeptidase [Alicyclobacillus curvatus]
MTLGSHRERIAKVRELLHRRNLHGIVLTEGPNVAWLFGGRYHINVVTEAACAAVYVSLNRVEALVNNIEAKRIEMEEGLLVDETHVHPWHDEAARQATMQSWLTEPGVVSDASLRDELRELRTVLEPDRVLAARGIGRLLAEALEETCLQAQEGESEFSVAARLSEACLRRGIEPIVNLVGNERRAQEFRHLLPTPQRIHQYAIVSVGGRKEGMVFSATRMFHFGPVPLELMQRYQSVLRVEAAFLLASRDGETTGGAFRRGIEQYAREGYADEWQLHHQGGIAGYQSREIRAVAESSWKLRQNVLLAWNPSIRGVKAEETAVVTDGGVEILTRTRTQGFPLTTVTVDGSAMELPNILVL